MPLIFDINGIMYATPIADFATTSVGLILVYFEVKDMKCLQAREYCLDEGVQEFCN